LSLSHPITFSWRVPRPLAASSGVQRRPVGVVGFPVQVGAGRQEALGGTALSGCTGVPEPLGHLLHRRACGNEQLLESVDHAERAGVPELLDPSAAGNQEAAHVPTAIPDRIVERGTDRPASDLDIGTAVDQRGRDIDVIAAGSPMQRRLRARLGVSVVGVSPGRDEKRNDLRAIREVPGQSATACKAVRVLKRPPSGPLASSGVSATIRWTASISPELIAATKAAAAS
jgi:hypothetical protein